MQTIKEALPDILLFFSIILTTLILDTLLHLTGKPEWGRYLGYWGTFLLILSFTYSARKRQWILFGKPRYYLRAHESLAWLGSVLILVHGGIHFNALLPWLAMVALLVASGSGWR